MNHRPHFAILVSCFLFITLFVKAQGCDTTRVRLEENTPYPFLPPYQTIDVTCLDSAFVIRVIPRIQCSSVAADGSNFQIARPDGTSMKVNSASVTNCVGDSGTVILIRLNTPFFMNMMAKMYIGQSKSGTYIKSFCAQRPWQNDSIRLAVQGCFQTEISLNKVWQSAAAETTLEWILDTVPYYPTYLFSKYSIYRKLNNQADFELLDSVSSIKSLRYIDKKLPANYKGNVDYYVGVTLVDLEVWQTDTLGIPMVLDENPLLYPVPFLDEFTVVFPTSAKRQVQVYSEVGELIYSEELDDFLVKIDTQNWPSGTFVLRCAEENWEQKIVKID